MTHYLALTIGPIFDTLSTARSTKALWSASYLFSWIMREALRKLRTRDGVTLLNLPNRPDFFDATKKGVGLFPDRFTAKVSSDFRLEDLKVVIAGVVGKLAEKVTTDLNNTGRQRYHHGESELPSAPLPDPYTVDEVEAFLRSALRVLAIEFDLPESDHNPVETADAYLTSLELRAAYVPELSRDPLNQFFEDIYYNFFIRQEFEDKGFKSTIEIATASFEAHYKQQYTAAVANLRAWEADDNSIASQKKQEEFVNAVREINRDRFHLCHKYIAIVRADGDHIGNLFKTMNKSGQLDNKAQRLADALADYSLAAVDAVESFGGVPVYAGGDDLLFFAPVSIEKKTEAGWERGNVFDLLDTLDGLFQEKVAGSELVTSILGELGGKIPTMSYGLSVSHYKYPLSESLYNAQRLLFNDIKNQGNRNGVAWQLTKHSGFGFGMVSKKDDNSFSIFKRLLSEKRTKAESGGVFLASVMHKLESLEGLIGATAHNPAAHFKNIIFNNFNESIHRTEVEINGKKVKELSPFLKWVVLLLEACFPENSLPSDAVGRKKAIRHNLERAYAALRFIHFLETDDKD